jgi:predicted NUDIX family NTP pyrophosphohydrolase
MPKLSAGIVLYRFQAHALEVLLVHPGGPFWKNKDLGAWSIPKGEYQQGESALDVARREYEEETGYPLGDGELIPLGEIKQPGGKIITAWALEGDCQAETITSNFFSMEWPPKSGKMQDFPEVDKAEWFSLPDAKSKILPGQAGFLDRLADHLRHILPDDEADSAF